MPDVTTLNTAIIRPLALDAMKETLSTAGVSGSRSPRSEGSGALRPHRDLPRGRVHVDFLPKLNVEVAAAGEEEAPTVEKAIADASRTYRIRGGRA